MSRYGLIGTMSELSRPFQSEFHSARSCAIASWVDVSLRRPASPICDFASSIIIARVAFASPIIPRSVLYSFEMSPGLLVAWIKNLPDGKSMP